MIQLHSLQRFTDAYDRLAAWAWAKHVEKVLSKRRTRFRRNALVIHESGDRFYATSRDISKAGIGLSHEVALPLGKVRISMDVGNGRSMKVQARLAWCQQQDDGSYISGVEFLAVPVVHLPTEAEVCAT
jgi:PilZ domain